MKDNDNKIFLDSGAYSAYKQDIEIDIHEYIKFIKQHLDVFYPYANLDVIVAPGKEKSDKESAELTLQNQQIMEESGLKPMPVFHRGEPEEYLKYYCKNYDYIGLGMGHSIGGRDLLRHWLNRIFSRYICDEHGKAKLKVHAFGMSSYHLLREFPWYSADSSTPLQQAINGQISVPQKRNGEWCYTEPPHVVNVKEVLNMPDNSYIKKLVLDWVKSRFNRF